LYKGSIDHSSVTLRLRGGLFSSDASSSPASHPFILILSVFLLWFLNGKTASGQKDDMNKEREMGE